MDTVAMTAERIDRARGALLGSAVGDALGVPYEFGTIPLSGDPEPLGGGLGNYEPGEWSDDTQMATCIARVAATGLRLTSQSAQDQIADCFLLWEREGASDIGVQTSRVLRSARKLEGTPAQRLRAASRSYAEISDRAAGNGALMRTAPVGLAFLHDRDLTAQAAREISALTHTDPMVGDTCVLWSEAIRLAVVEGVIDVYAGLDLLHPDVRETLSRALREAEEPGFMLVENSFTVSCMQAAWHSVKVGMSSDDPVKEGLFAAVRQGSDTDTTAAVAGGLLGAAYGASRVPPYEVHGWPGMTGREYADLAVKITAGSTEGW
ncbi:MAG: ADP-ribosylglycohydrolase family protein [Flaviflexus sp.]|nr:ADP-ribosylglycohydrolase family protein [Flaviflexus sp.]